MNLRDWRLKGLIQKVLSAVPGGGWVNDALQLGVGGLKDFEKNIAAKLSDWELMTTYIHRVNRRIEGQWLVEIGSGWYPTLPICHILGGAARVSTVDIVFHAKENLIFRMFRALEPHLDQIAACSGRPAGQVRDHYAKLARARNMRDLYAAAGIEYRAPEDAARLDLPSKSVDIVYSNSVFEHVTPNLIVPILRESHRVLKDDGLSVHAIACNDHYAFFDPSISFVHFLQFTNKQWRFWNNRFNYQNRLRASDYTRMAEEAGFRIAYEARAVQPGSREALATFKIAPEFQGYSVEDLVATTVDFVAAKALGGDAPMNGTAAGIDDARPRS